MTKRINQGRWTESEHQRYEDALKMGLSWKKLSKVVASRTIQQCRSHHQKMKLLSSCKRISRSNISMQDASTQYEPQMSDHAMQASEFALSNVERLFKSFCYLSEDCFEQPLYLGDALPKSL